MQSKRRKGIQLDCSARFYPIIATKKAQSLFHIAVRLDGEVSKDLLARATEDVLPLFPTFKTTLKAGYAWYKLVENSAPVRIFDHDGAILAPISKKETNGYLFRLGVKGDVIHLDFFHGLSDGKGALAFLLAILRRMRRLEGRALPEDSVADVSAPATDPELSEDAFLRYYKPIKLSELDLKSMAGRTPHRRAGTFLKDGYKYIRYEADSAALMRDVKSTDASFTAYLAGMVASCIERFATDGKPLVLMIPVDLRATFPSKTQRNFVLFTRIVIDPNKCVSLDDYVAEAKRQLADGIQKEALRSQLSTTVKGMTHPVMSVVPLPLKKLFARIGRLFMRSRQTIIISNIGKIDVAPEYGIKSVVFNLNVSKNNVQNLAVTTYGGRTTFSFTSAIKEDDLERSFADALQERGISATRM